MSWVAKPLHSRLPERDKSMESILCRNVFLGQAWMRLPSPLPMFCGPDFVLSTHNCKEGSVPKRERKHCSWEVVLRWRRNRMRRTLSPSQIHQKNISTLSKFHKTTSECWQRTSGTQKSRSLSSKTGRKNIKDEKGDKGGREGAPSQEGNLKKRGLQTPVNTLTAESVESLGSTEGNITGRKNK